LKARKGVFLLSFIKDERASPIVEEAILIGLAMLGLAIMLNVMFTIFNWSSGIANNFFNYINNMFNGFF